MRNIIVILLLVVAVATTYWFWFKPPVSQKFDMTTAYEYVLPEKGVRPLLAPAPTVDKYAKFKQELKEWLDISGKAIPVVSCIGALWIRKRGKKKK